MPLVENTQTKTADLAYIRNAMQTDLLERDEEHDLAVAWKTKRDVVAMQKLINAYRRMVIAQAAKFKHYGLPMSDLIQEGNVGLLEAMNRFEPERDLRFSTYATWWVRSYLQDFVLRNWSIVRTGTTSAQKSLFFNLRRLKAKIEGRDGTWGGQDLRDQIATELNVSRADVDRMDARLAVGDQSLNLPVGEDGDTELQSLFSGNEPNPEDVVMHLKDGQRRTKWLKEALETLSEREQKIIKQRHLSYNPVTLEDLGKKLGVSKERVRQLESRALDRLKISLAQKISNPSDLWIGALN